MGSQLVLFGDSLADFGDDLVKFQIASANHLLDNNHRLVIAVSNAESGTSSGTHMGMR